MINQIPGESFFMKVSPPSIVNFLQQHGVKFEPVFESEGELKLVFRILAKPGAKLNKIALIEGGEIAVYSMARAVEGAANKAIVKQLAKAFGPSPRCFEIISGERSKEKRIAIHYIFSDHKSESYYLKKLEESFL